MITENIEIDTRCTGCEACRNVCPTGAISMEYNEEGFLMPTVDEVLCKKCGLCDEVCQINDESTQSTFRPDFYAAINLDESVLNRSSSGGVFFALAEYVIKREGIVVGCAFDDNLVARHKIAYSLEECAAFQGSKYVQSQIGNVLNDVKIALETGRYVLFSGTPCQIRGLQLFLKHDYEKLITVDIICHGVPSPKLWQKHIDWLENKRHHKIKQYRFRSKIKPNQSLYYYYYYYHGMKKRFSGYAKLDAYYHSFLKCENCRECCYACKFAKVSRVADFSIGDFWGVAKYHPEIDRSKGVSLLMVNSMKARELLPSLRESLHLVQSKAEWATARNSNLVKATERPLIRNMFYSKVYVDVNRYELDNQRSMSWLLLKIKNIIPNSFLGFVSCVKHNISGLSKKYW